MAGIDGLAAMSSMPLTDAQFLAEGNPAGTFADVAPGGYFYFQQCMAIPSVAGQAMLRLSEPVIEMEDESTSHALNCYAIAGGWFARIDPDTNVTWWAAGSAFPTYGPLRVAPNGARFFVEGEESHRRHGPFLKLAHWVSPQGSQGDAKPRNVAWLSTGILLMVPEKTTIIHIGRPIPLPK